jgi:catechol 2,3-dioxygenase-like lactoylglutathione lyase family enzyme
MRATAIPILPCRNVDETVAFYGLLGFELLFEQPAPDPYAIVGWGDVELHFFSHPGLDPAGSIAGCYLRVADADRVHASWRSLGLPVAGIPRLSEIADRPWGLREFQVVDPNGNLVRVGHVLE